MKKVIALPAVLAAAIGVYAYYPRTVQGIPYTPPETKENVVRTSDYPEDPDDLSVPEGEFTFDMIECWSGEGANKAALVIQWNDPEETNALVFGYRWDGLATGADMIRAVVSDHPQLYGLIQYTNVSSPTDPLGGYTINGFGWDRDCDGDIALKDTKDNQIYYSEDGLFIHPRGYDPDKGGSSDYDYDDWIAVDQDDFWGAGWYLSYWSYWVKGSQDATFGYSGWGASGRVLEDGCWDGWNFSLDMMPSDWKKFKAAPNPIPDGTVTEFKVDGLYYNLTNYTARKVALTAPFEIDGETLTAYSGDIVIPASITVGEETYNVTEIKANAFEDTNIGEVTIPASLAKIGDYAFLNSTLSKLQMADEAVVPSLGKGVFSGCERFSQFILPLDTKVIPDELFKGTAVSDIVLEGIEKTGISSFENCTSLTELVVPETVKSFGEKCFSGCTNLKSVTVNTTFPPACAADAFGNGASTNAILNVPVGYTQAFSSATGWSEFDTYNEFSLDVKSGDRFALDGVAYIVTSADDNMTVKVTYHKTVDDKADATSIITANQQGYIGDVIVPATVVYQGKSFIVNEIDDKAFYGAGGMLTVSLPEGIAVIPPYTFQDCTSLTSALIPSTITEIGDNAFAYCSELSGLTLPDGLLSLGNRCFQNTGMKSINIPASLTSLPDYCFYGCALTAISLGDQLTQMGANCFQNCRSLVSAILPSSLENLPSSVFSNCSSLQEINIPESVTSIGSSAFAGCSSLENINLPSALKDVGSGMLQNCSSLKEVSLPPSVTSLQSSLFSGCSSLEKVTLSPEITAIPQSAFANCSKLHTIAYYGDNDENVPGVIGLGAKTVSIAQYAFQGCSAITEMILPDGFTAIAGREPFKNTGLTELIIPASVTSMNQNYICGNNDAVTFYMCGTEPVAVNKFTFAKSSGKYDFPIVVPTGYAETYRAANNWNYYTVSEPVVESLSLRDMKMTGNTLTGHLGVNYDITLPERFALVNNAIALDGYTISITLTAEGSDTVTLIVTPSDNGAFIATVEGLTGTSGVHATAVAAKGDISFSSEAIEVEVNNATYFYFSEEEYNAHFDEQYSPELVFNDDIFTLSDINFSSSDTDVASVNKRTGKVSVKRVSGDAVIRAFVVDYPEIFAEMTIHSALATPVENFVLGDGSKNITLSYMDIYALCPTVVPDNADIQSYDVIISDPEVATTYSVTAFNPTRKYFELVTHKPGEVDVTFKAQDGSDVETTYHFTVVDSDRSEAKDSWQDGTFWLNEDWFGHTNGSINYIDKDGNIRYRAYESQNPYESFGCTSQYAMIFGGNLYVMSKQATDGGDPRTGGGRLVVADAKTMHKLAGFDDILDDGDGRACVGVNSEKVYIGTTAGIAIFNPSNLTITGKVEGIESGGKYANQLGDMVCAGKYVFAIKQAYGTYVIDTETDEVVATLGRDEDGKVTAYPQGVTMTSDGMVWIAATSSANGKATTLYCYDPADLSLVKAVEMPSHLSITCGWGAWRSTNFFAEQDDVAIWFGSGVEASIVSGNSGYYRWDTQSDLADIRPVYVFPKDLVGMDDKTMQAPYASVRYDNRSNMLLIAATHGSSSNYRNNWLHFVDCATGEIARTIRLKDYYWFPAIPVFPDKYAPEFEDPGSLEIDLQKDKDGVTVDISVSDRDNVDKAISMSIVNITPVGEAVFDAALQGNKLTIVPRATGGGEIQLKAESNGVSTFLSIPVKVMDGSTGIGAEVTDGTMMSITGRRFHAVGFNGHMMRVYSAGGTLVAEFDVTEDDYSVTLPVEAGVYVIVDQISNRTLKCVIK